MKQDISQGINSETTPDNHIATPANNSNSIPAASSKPPKPKALIAISVICSILTIVGIAFGVYGMLEANQKSTDLAALNAKLATVGTNLITNLGQPSEESIPSVVTESADTSVREVISSLQTTFEDELNLGVVKVYDQNFPLVKVDGVDTLLTLEKSYELYYNGNDFSAEQLNAEQALANTSIQNLGFIENGDISGPKYIIGGANFINPNTNIVCNWGEGRPLSLSCGESSWISSETISLAKELTKAYYDKVGENPFSLPRLNKASITNSSVSPYQTLKTTVANARGLFYRTSPDAEWQYFTATQMVIPCSEFNTTDLKNAFAGEICYDESTSQNSTVQP